MTRKWGQLTLGVGRSRIASDTSSEWKQRFRSDAPRERRAWLPNGGSIKRIWRDTSPTARRRVAVVLVACIGAAELAAAGYVIGDENGPGAGAVAEARQSYFQAAFAAASLDAAPLGEQRGREAGARAGRRASERAGARLGTGQGAAAVARQQEAIAAAAAARAARRDARRAAQAAEAAVTEPVPTVPAAAPQAPAEPCFDAAGFPC
jgi:hypothetical protein